MKKIAILLMLSLTGCTVDQPGKPSVSVQLPKPPAYYMACFKKLTPEPQGKLTRDRVVKLIAELRQSEKRKSECGKALLSWYDTVSMAASKKG